MRRLLFLILIASFSACESTQRELSIPFVVQFNGEDLHCDSGLSLSMTDLRFFAYDIEFHDASGAAIAARLVRDGAWQSNKVGMVDLETGVGACDDGTAAVNDVIRVSISGDQQIDAFSGLAFTLGVPFDLNHDNPLKAAAPLDDSAMHWHWRSGYKFLRAGVETGNDGFWFHLGSTACRGTTGHISGCDHPNRVRVELTGFRPGRDRVVVDLGRLFAGIDLADGVRSDCSSGPTETACPPVLAALGLSGADGRMLEGVFSTQPLADKTAQ